jgi:hypothetical protein
LFARHRSHRASRSWAPFLRRSLGPLSSNERLICHPDERSLYRERSARAPFRWLSNHRHSYEKSASVGCRVFELRVPRFRLADCHRPPSCDDEDKLRTAAGHIRTLSPFLDVEINLASSLGVARHASQPRQRFEEFVTSCGEFAIHASRASSQTKRAALIKE